jgi:hypothetical protein
VQVRLVAIAAVADCPKLVTDTYAITRFDAGTARTQVPEKDPHAAALENDIVAREMSAVDGWRSQIRQPVNHCDDSPRTGSDDRRSENLVRRGIGRPRTARAYPPSIQPYNVDPITLASPGCELRIGERHEMSVD